MREQIADIKQKILRPTNNIDVLTLDIDEEFCTYLKSRPFGDEYASRLDYYTSIEGEQADAVFSVYVISSVAEKSLNDFFFSHPSDEFGGV